jgi:hypothetical protein
MRGHSSVSGFVVVILSGPRNLEPKTMAVKRTAKEISVENELVRRVEAAGGQCLKVRIEGRRGFFDRLVALPGGKIIFAECKRPVGGRLAFHQIWYADAFTVLGAKVALIRNSADIDQLLLR